MAGDKLYIIKNNKYLGRHINCERNQINNEAPTTENEHLDLNRKNRKTVGGAKKQRTSGHGYTGGTGFKTI